MWRSNWESGREWPNDGLEREHREIKQDRKKANVSGLEPAHLLMKRHTIEGDLQSA